MLLYNMLKFFSIYKKHGKPTLAHAKTIEILFLFAFIIHLFVQFDKNNFLHFGTITNPTVFQQ